jgi:dihydrofolate reductase
MPNKVFIATSLDGFIAQADGDIAFLDTYPPQDEDMGYAEFMSNIDALIMGRKTFEKVMSFGIEWPYSKPVFVWTQSLQQLPENLPKNVSLISGNAESIHQKINDLGFHNIYIDGGQTIQSFLQANLIDEITITTVPVLLGNGIALFGNVDSMKLFKCCQTRLFKNGYVMNQFVKP